MKFPYQLIELTHILDETSPSWEENCGFSSSIVLDYADCTSETSFRVQHLTMPAGMGTHMDAPSHCCPDGLSIDQIPLDKLAAPCVVIDVSQKAHDLYSVVPQDIADFEKKHGLIQPNSFVIIKTGWSRFWDTSIQYRNNYHFPSVSAETATLLVSRGIVGLGIDTLSPDRPDDGYPVHRILLSSGRYIVENIANSEQLPPTGSFVMAFPLKIKQATETPMRLIGLLP
ncbi:TPA: cyclase family protein [Legionella pneumophila]|uniref:cyclase family protein n=1 Tax=Legionella TaxID=445 RepID=UPI0007783A8A|nr:MULTISPECIES: cyclase family protein [Legionella]QRN03500.1 cyclase family protein [Legionella sp. MW5194]HAT4451848.1 cyclase family protein [Legionella pneumophila]HAT7914058.1 cyclase family protein [Legionella pneumophila]HAT8642312.1 cyclase family protein [Legionella pneumophila]HAT8969476.1 cyclase family protein [Legionella pneumophila subsp. pneumophila]